VFTRWFAHDSQNPTAETSRLPTGDKLKTSRIGSKIAVMAECPKVPINILYGSSGTESLGQTQRDSKKQSSDSELKHSQTTRGETVTHDAIALQAESQNMPFKDATATDRNPQSDTQYQSSKTATLEHTVKPIPSLVSGTKVTHLDFYHRYGGDMGIVDRTDEYGEVFVTWGGGGQGRYSVDKLIPRTDTASDLAQLLANALKSTRQGIKTALNELVAIHGKLTVLAASFSLSLPECQNVRMLID
jgi:hypothetical protein